MKTDSDYIYRCIALARLGQTKVAPNPMVGAILVDSDGQIIAEGWHEEFGGPHAEVNCFADLDKRYSQAQQIQILPHCTLFVSLEPCNHYGKTPPCTELIISKGVKRVVVGTMDPNPLVAGHGIKKLKDAGIEVIVGVNEQACRELNKRFICLHEKKRPYVILKWAQTADGYLDAKRTDGKPLKISNAITKQFVHKMRAENMAIMVGTNTAILDNPKLTTTHWVGPNPIRILVDRHSKVSMDANIFSNEAPTIVYKDNTDWQYILNDLRDRGIHSIIVEGGATLLNNILQTGIYDEIHIEVAPIKIGDGVPAPNIILPFEPDAEYLGNKQYIVKHTLSI